MTRLYDAIMRADMSRSPHSRIARSELAGATVLDATNVALWYYATAQAAGEAWDSGDGAVSVSGDFGRCVPPFASTFVEFPVPTKGAGSYERTGIHVLRDDQERGWRLYNFGWVLQGETVGLAGNHSCLIMTADGVPDWRDPESRVFAHAAHAASVASATGFTQRLTIALLAFRFSHARGVAMTECSAPRHARRQAEREGHPAPTKYYTLEIRPVTKLLEADGRARETGVSRALHLCRGHFADYTQGAGLFGKHKVEVFVPEHLRGRQDRGVVIKDYAVRTAPG